MSHYANDRSRALHERSRCPGAPQRVPLAVDDAGNRRDRRAAPRPGAGSRGRAHADQHRAAASGDARRVASRARARRRDRRALHSAHRLPALRVRENRRVPPVQPDHPVDRPRGLSQLDRQQRRVRARRGAAVRHRDHAAVHGASGHRAGAVADHRRTWCGSARPASTSAPSRRSSGRSRSGRTSTACSRIGSARASRRRRPASAAWRPTSRTAGSTSSADSSATFPQTLDEVDRMLTRNAIWVGRTVGLGVMSAEDARELRAVGADAARVRRRVRRAQGFPVPRLRDVRLRRAGRDARRCVRSVSRARWRSCASRCGFSSRPSSGCPTVRSTSTILA